MLAQRDAMLRKLRAFFHDCSFIEVETPLLADEIIPELHIEPIRTADGAFLQASPELHMKRMLAAGAAAIFQITRSFRDGERGMLHNPEFTIVEWYRAGDDMQAGIDLLDALTQSLLGTPPCTRTTYAEAFQRTLDLCPHTAPIEDLEAAAAAAQVAIPSGINRTDRDEWLNLLLAQVIERKLGSERPEIIYHYPASQASLAKTVRGLSPFAESAKQKGTVPLSGNRVIGSNNAGYDVAERFELYYRGIELANGFHELTDAAEQRRRLEEVNAARVADGRPALPIPESLLAALARGLPDCTGCALGFDRLVMLAVDANALGEVLAFPAAVQPPAGSSSCAINS
jgi:lysyl-tRNA synthetase class 2